MNLGGIILFIKDMQAAIAYYRDILGLHPDEEQPFPANSFFRFNTGQCKLCLHKAGKPNGGRQKIVFHVESVNDVHRNLEAKGLQLRPLKNEDGQAIFDIRAPKEIGFGFGGTTNQVSLTRFLTLALRV